MGYCKAALLMLTRKQKGKNPGSQEAKGEEPGVPISSRVLLLRLKDFAPKLQGSTTLR